MEIELEGSDVLRVVMQFLREQELHESVRVLQEESQVSLNVLSPAELGALETHLQGARWDHVLSFLKEKDIQLPIDLQIDLHEHIFLHLIHSDELHTAFVFLSSSCLNDLEQSRPNRFLQLKSLLTEERTHISAQELNKAKENLAKRLLSSIQIAEPSRLLNVLGDALKWQRFTGRLPEGCRLLAPDLETEVEEDMEPQHLERKIKFDQQSEPECCLSTPDGRFLVSGSSEGFIEVWDSISGQLAGLSFQKQGNLMVQSDAVLCLGSKDGQVMASGSQNGEVKLWDIESGKCLRTLKAHEGAVTCLDFAGGDSSELVTGSQDGLLRVFGLVSGQLLREFRGHQGFVSSARFASGGSIVISGGSDGILRLWDSSTCTCIQTLTLWNDSNSDSTLDFVRNSPVSIRRIIPLDRMSDELFLILGTTSPVFLVSASGQIVDRFALPPSSSSLCDLCLSPGGDFLYVVCEAGVLYTIAIKTKKLVHARKLHKKRVKGIVGHVHKNILASFSSDRSIKLWTVDKD